MLRLMYSIADMNIIRIQTKWAVLADSHPLLLVLATLLAVSCRIAWRAVVQEHYDRDWYNAVWPYFPNVFQPNNGCRLMA